MRKMILLASSGLLTLGLTGAMPAFSNTQDEPPPPPPPKKKEAPAKKKDEPGPVGDLRRAYDLLRKIKAEDGTGGRGDERLKGWTDRATGLYRQGVKAFERDDPRRAHEYGAAAHDLARSIDHARNAARFDHAAADPDLPPPPRGDGPAGDGAEARRELRHAFDRINEMEDDAADDKDARYYLDGARDLYTAARRDAEDGRNERAVELARAAEALTHVPEHLAHAEGRDPGPPRDEPKPRPKAKRKGDEPEPKERPEPKEKREAKEKRDRPGDDEEPLPPPLRPRF